MKINKKYESSIYDNVVLSTEEQQTLIPTSADKWSQYEKICRQISQTTATSIVPTQDFDAALYYLDAKIAASRKTLSAYDAFKIVDSVDEQDELETKYALLSENSGLIINIDVDFNNISFSAGDIIFKDFYGKIHKIANTVRGFYYPYGITYDSTTKYYTLTYAFKTGFPNLDETISVSFPNAETQPATAIYNVNEVLPASQSKEITAIEGVHPIWEIRLYSEGAIGEKIFNAVKITAGDKYTITNLTSQDLWIMAK